MTAPDVTTTTTSRFARWAPLTGVLFFVLTIAGTVLGSTDSPDFVAPPAEFAAYFNDRSGEIIFGSMLGSLGAFFLLWFLGSVYDAARRAEGAEGRLATMAFGGGVAGSALLLASYAVTGGAALRADDQGGISDDIAAVMGDLSSVLGFFAAPFGFAVLLGGCAVIAVRTGGLFPRWLGWVSAILAIGLVVPFISWAVMLVFPLWVVIVSILLYRRQSTE